MNAREYRHQAASRAVGVLGGIIELGLLDQTPQVLGIAKGVISEYNATFDPFCFTEGPPTASDPMGTF